MFQSKLQTEMWRVLQSEGGKSLPAVDFVREKINCYCSEFL